MIADIKYDTPIKVTATQYMFAITKFHSVIAYRRDESGFYIKLWDMRFANILADRLNDIKN